MLRSFLLTAAILLLFHALPAVAQASGNAAPETTATLQAAYDQAMQAHDWSGAVVAARQLAQLSASSQHLLQLADAQLRAASAQRDQPAMEQSLTTYDRALSVAELEKPAQGQPDTAWKDGRAKIELGKGNALLLLHRTSEAVDAYTRAAALASNPGLACFNICATFYNAGDIQNALPACRKAARAEPTRANVWFLLGSLLYAGAPANAQSKFVITAENRQALEKYLELAPGGPHAADVKAMLQMAAP